MLNAMAAGETDPVRLAALAHSGVKASQAALQQALRGRVTAHHRFLLQLHLGQIDRLEAAIAMLDKEIETHFTPFRTAVELLSSIPALSTLRPEVTLLEIGLDMPRFPTAGHLLAWAGLCPRSDESAGKRRSNRLRKGAPWLKKAICAVAASILTAVYHMLKDGT